MGAMPRTTASRDLKIVGADNFHRLKRPLTQDEIKILASVHPNPQGSVPEVSREVNLPPYVVRHTLHWLRKQRVIEHPVPFVDVYALGFVEYAFFINISNPPGEEFDDALLADPLVAEGVSLVVQTSGPFNFIVLIYARSALEAQLRFQKLSECYAYRIVKKTVSTRTTYRFYGYRYFSRQATHSYPLRHFGLNLDCPSTALDEIDMRVLIEMGKGDGCSKREIARRLKLPSSTVDSRVHRLERLNVIQGYEYNFSPGTLGKRKFRLLLSADLRGGKTTEILLKLANEDLRIVVLNECLGEWEYELLVHLGDTEPLSEFTDRIFQRLEGAVRTIHTIVNVRRYRLERFPFSSNNLQAVTVERARLPVG